MSNHEAAPEAAQQPVAAVVIPNWNGESLLASCIDSLLSQSTAVHVIVVDNGSSDGSLRVLDRYPTVEVIRHAENRGFAGGVNAGFRRAIELGFEYVGAFNSDAIADPTWLEHLVQALRDDDRVGIATPKLLSGDALHLDSAGDCYTSWGLPYPRGRHEPIGSLYGEDVDVFGASGGASLFRVATLQDIGLFDEQFFAYFEDIDLSFRAQLAGWRIRYVAGAVVHHQIGGTSRRMKGFVARQTSRNTPLVIVKNVPLRYFPHLIPRFLVGQVFFLVWAFRHDQGGSALAGYVDSARLFPYALRERRRIRTTKRVSDEHVWSIIEHRPPPRGRIAQIHALLRRLAWRS